MLKFKNIIIASAIFLSLLVIISNSSANEIISMYPQYNSGYYTYDGSLYHTSYLKTDVAFYDIYWYINGDIIERTDGSNNTTEAYFTPYSTDYPGSPFGIDYEIKAEVWWLDENGNSDSRTSSYNVTVYTTPDVDAKQGFHTEAQGNASANAGWNGSTAEATISGSITNNGIHDISYVMNLFYAVGKLQANGNLDENNLFDQPDGIQILHGSINANDESQSVDFPSFSDSFEIVWFDVEDSFSVQASMTIAAWHSGQEQNQNNTDNWFASMNSTWDVK